MNAAIKLEDGTLADLGMSNEEFERAVANALSILQHPVTGHPVYFQNVSVSVVKDQSATG